MFESLAGRFLDLEKKVERNTKFVIGATAVIATIVTIAQVAVPVLTRTSVTSTITGTELVRPG